MRFSHVALLGFLGFVSCAPQLPTCGGGGSSPKPEGTNEGNGRIRMGGAAREYHVSGDETKLLLLVKRVESARCSFFHHHAIAALSVRYTFDLDKDDPSTSTLTATVQAQGLDPDRDEYRAAFSETAGSSMTDAERRDIRTNMLNQVDAAHHPFFTFTATNLSTLDGPGTATVTLVLKEQTSELTMEATARWEDGKLVIDGTGVLEGGKHGMPVGTFSSCVEPNMPMMMHLVLAPGTDTLAQLPQLSHPTLVLSRGYPEKLALHHA